MNFLGINRKKVFHLFFLFLFFTITLFINFFHTESYFSDSDKCPACHFQNSVFSTSQINFFHLPPPTVTGILNAIYPIHITYIITTIPSSRSPPEM